MNGADGYGVDDSNNNNNGGNAGNGDVNGSNNPNKKDNKNTNPNCWPDHPFNNEQPALGPSWPSGYGTINNPSPNMNDPCVGFDGKMCGSNPYSAHQPYTANPPYYPT